MSEISSRKKPDKDIRLMMYDPVADALVEVDSVDPLPVRTSHWHKFLNGYDPDVVTTGAFGADTDWTKGTGWTIAVGVATHATGNPGTILSQDISAEDGETYLVTFDVSAFTSGSVTPKVGGMPGTARVAAGSFTEEIVAGGSGLIEFEAGATGTDFVGSIDNVVVRKKVTDGVFTLTPNLAVESTLFVDITDIEGFVDLYFRTLTSTGTNGLDDVAFNVRSAYMWDDDGETTHPVDPGASNEIELDAAVDMSAVDTVTDHFSLTGFYSTNGTYLKFMHSKFLVIACTNDNNGGDDAGTILVYIGGR